MNSYTEGGPVGSHYRQSVVLSSKHLIESQGLMVDHKKSYQDDKIFILVEKYGRASSTQLKKHIKALHF